MTSKRLKRAYQTFTQKQLEWQQEFSHLTQAEYDAHIKKRDYDGFVLTDAITPSPSLSVIPRTGFRKCTYQEPNDHGALITPCLIISASKEILFNLFLDLLAILEDDTVRLVFEASHNSPGDTCRPIEFSGVDIVVLKSKLCEFEDTITNDGEMGVFVLDHRPIEVGLSNHKEILVYNWHLAVNDILKILSAYEIQEDAEMFFLHEAGHIHHTTERHFQMFTQLKNSFEE